MALRPPEVAFDASAQGGADPGEGHPDGDFGHSEAGGQSGRRECFLVAQADEFGGASGKLLEAPSGGARQASERVLAKYRLQAHYLSQGCFTSEHTLLEIASGLNHMPVALIHGTHDLVCPPENAVRLRCCDSSAKPRPASRRAARARAELLSWDSVADDFVADLTAAINESPAPSPAAGAPPH